MSRLIIFLLSLFSLPLTLQMWWWRDFWDRIEHRERKSSSEFDSRSLEGPFILESLLRVSCAAVSEVGVTSFHPQFGTEAAGELAREEEIPISILSVCVCLIIAPLTLVRKEFPSLPPPLLILPPFSDMGEEEEEGP